MCGRYVAPNEAAMRRFWRIDRVDSHNPLLQRFNVAPTTAVPIFLLGSEGEHVLDEARWGLIPTWWKKDVPPGLTFNARSEEGFEKPTWRHAIRHTRCLMPACGWYEWNEADPTRSSTGRKVNQPYFLSCPTDPVIAFAGLWTTWQSPQGGTVLSCALLSREAAPAIHVIHHRMPVVLAPDQFSDWLSPSTPPDAVASLIENARGDFIGRRVSTRVNNTRNDSPDLLEEIPSASLF